MTINEALTTLADEDIVSYVHGLKHHKEADGVKDIDISQIFKKPFKKENRDAWINAKAKFNKFERGNFMDYGSQVEEVNFDDLWPGQIGLNEENLIEKFNAQDGDWEKKPHAVRLTVKGEERTILIDGHHRVAADILKGLESAPILVKTDNWTWK